MMSWQPVLLGLLAAALRTTASAPRITDLFVPSDRYPCFRQPVLIAAGNTLIAFAENRNVSACSPAADLQAPLEVGSLLYRRSTDGGVSWGEVTSLYFHPGLNIDFLTAVADPVRRTVWLMLQQAGTVVVFQSADLGRSWTGPRDLFEHWNVASPWPDLPTTSLKPGCAHGIRIRPELCRGGQCAQAGRLVVPFVATNTSVSGNHSDQACSSCLGTNLFTDDGETWQMGGLGPPGSRESWLAQLPSDSHDAELAVNLRNMGEHPGRRLSAVSSDAGTSYGQYRELAELREPVTPHWTGVVAGGNAIGHRLLFSGPADPAARANLTVRVSDDGVTWSGGKSLWAGPAGYSDMAVLEESVAVVFENGRNQFAEKISVAVFNQSWLNE